MQRRDLIRFTFAGAVSGTFVPRALFASPTSDDSNPMAGSVFFTKDAPGRWRGKEASHLPQIEIEKKSDGISVKVSTPHEVSGFDHYIIKHILLDGNYGLLGEKMFNPLKDKAAISTFSLSKYNGPIYALSVCNKHDTWLSSAEV
uniref:Superoxide reductase n=1 Tax=Candidatus Kentrum eta TaxID=2126337 RepID=A0A450VHL9_9GAMM|nr:MAG: superoxide reductase [Candidatus Kentron sp. H]VFK04240.1 MAG: superoxide reductase [Candidatus Kentron sp. H]VFK07068.1 MAG: superoxide reductase [Candidatus Kentron sp. H]